MEKRLPLDEANYKQAIKGLIKLKLKERAEENGSNELGKKIRESALESFRYLREDPRAYNTKQLATRLAASSNHVSQAREYSVITGMDS